MNLKIAIQPDEMVHPTGQRQSFSERWTELARSQNIEPVPVDVFSHHALNRVAACDAFMWRYPSSAGVRSYGKRLMNAVASGLGVPVFPMLQSLDYYEDKPAQCLFLRRWGFPRPRPASSGRAKAPSNSVTPPRIRSC